MGPSQSLGNQEKVKVDKDSPWSLRYIWRKKTGKKCKANIFWMFCENKLGEPRIHIPAGLHF